MVKTVKYPNIPNIILIIGLYDQALANHLDGISNITSCPTHKSSLIEYFCATHAHLQNTFEILKCTIEIARDTKFGNQRIQCCSVYF